MNDLEKAREKINKIDREMAKLFCERMKAAEEVAKYKKEHALPITDKAREEALILKNAEYIDDDILKQYYSSFIKNSLELSKKYQKRLLEGMTVAYSGVRGAFANIAAERIFPGSTYVAYKSFSSAYEAAARGECDCAVLPIENSYEGEVGQVLDLMFAGSMYVSGIYDLPVTHSLLGIKGASLSDIRKVMSHPQALGQCAPYILKHSFEEIQATNTAVAAQSVAEYNDISIAAIASEETARLYNLEVIDHDINESGANTTRFAVFSRAQTEEPNNSNFLLMFTVNNSAGSLAKAISVIGDYGFNMKSLHSRPMKELAWKYYFYIEAEGSMQSERARSMLSKLGKYCDKLKVVGNYTADTILKNKDGANDY